MLRSACFILFIALAICVLPSDAQSGASTIEAYFTGKEVVLKIDMPGTQKGVDLRFNKATPMDWKEYSGRIKQSGTAIRKGDTARVTAIVVKKDVIEFQLDGGGFGTFGDDTTTKVEAKAIDKSDYEKDLEKQISETTDEDRKIQLQRDLDRERARREKQEAANQRAAQVASQMKAQQVADKRAQGGSRFNLRWSGSIPADQLTPEAVIKLLADYVEFSGSMVPSSASPAQSNAAPGATSNGAADGSPTGQLKRGMKMEEVTSLLGAGKQLSESVGAADLKTLVFEYLTDDRRVEVTYVDGLVVRFSVSSK